MFLHILSYPRRAFAAYYQFTRATCNRLLDWLATFVKIV
jgi:hypothetical protein